MTASYKYLLAGIIMISAFVACQKNDLDIYAPESANNEMKLFNCSRFKYSDSIFFLQSGVSDYIVNPVNSLNGGTFGALPQGLSINSTTGAINVSESETGLRYKVFFTKNNSTDTCFKYVIISGINYLDSVYVLNGNNTFATPIYNANLNDTLPCSSGDDDDGDDDDCEFDDGDDDDYPDSEPPQGEELIPQGIAISKLNGRINLKKTVENGTFGTIPVNGAYKDVTLYYRIGDGSNLSLNKMDIRFYYFATMADVPAELLEEMQDKLDITYVLGKTTKNRPPYIVIVGG